MKLNQALPFAILGATLYGGSAEAGDKKHDAYELPDQAGMCNANPGANLLDLQKGQEDINTALADTLGHKPSRKELAYAISTDLLATVLNALTTDEADAGELLKLIEVYEAALKMKVASVDMSNEADVKDAIESLRDALEGLAEVRAAVSVLQNNNGRALTRRQLLTRYTDILGDVDTAVRVDRGVDVMESASVSSQWDCTTIPMAYGQLDGQWPTLNDVRELDAKDQLNWVAPEFLIVGRQDAELEYNTTPVSEMDARQARAAFAELYEANLEQLKGLAEDVVPVVEQFEARQGVDRDVVLKEAPSSALDMVWTFTPVEPAEGESPDEEATSTEEAAPTEEATSTEEAAPTEDAQ